MTDITDQAIDAALAACELAKPGNGNSGAPAIIAIATHEPDDIDIDRLIDELTAFAHARSAQTSARELA